MALDAFSVEVLNISLKTVHSYATTLEEVQARGIILFTVLPRGMCKIAQIHSTHILAQIIIPEGTTLALKYIIRWVRSGRGVPLRAH